MDIMMDARDLSAGSVLSNGKVLVIGEYSDFAMTSLDSSELYDSSTVLGTTRGSMKNCTSAAYSIPFRKWKRANDEWTSR